ncbi:hypothetical protein [Nocardia mexicana]|uniref:Secreted protein n=1 Tax=Nocardia mexicana TaxID=279262 RepID=A0A370GXW6_9NOCA|nr:hypothetical protein [Nocardia mexicana]RDI48441.1 hypothetical protein DFR68_108274 [Nocardia mexicana]
MSFSTLSRVLACGFAGAAALFAIAPAAVADPPEWEVPKSCSGTFPTSDGAADVESCLYIYEGALRAYGSLTSKTGNSTIDNCTMVVTVIDKDAYSSGLPDERIAISNPMPCYNGSYPSPPLTIGKERVMPGHHYAGFTEITHNGQGVARIYSPELIP